MKPLPMLLHVLTCLLLLSGSVLHAQVKVYGMTTLGGSRDVGTLYSMNLDGTDFQRLYAFQDQPDGKWPFGGLTMKAGDSKLYGLTGFGGASNAGTVFSYDTATQTYQKLADFTGTNGSAPSGTLTWAGGKFYGLANRGGAHGVGAIFSFDPAANALEDLYDMDSSAGIYPNGNMYPIGGKLYFATFAGGAYNGGTMMSFDPVTNICTDIYDFAPHSGPASYFTVVGDLLYGNTFGGGGSGSGNLFSFNPITTAYRDRNDFYTYFFGLNPMGVGSYNGVIYGTVQGGGPNYSNGLIFSYNPTTQLASTVYEFDNEFSFNGSSPPNSNLIITSTGQILGVMSAGGTDGRGTFYSYDLNTHVYTVLHNFDANAANPVQPYLPGAH